MSIEQEFADKLVQYKHIIYKVCFMYCLLYTSDAADEL